MSETCHDCPKILKDEVIIVSVWGMHLCVPCYLKRLEQKYSCPVCKLPIRGRQRTTVKNGLLIHEGCQ